VLSFPAPADFVVPAADEVIDETALGLAFGTDAPV
jgi:hypothetical protein